MGAIKKVVGGKKPAEDTASAPAPAPAAAPTATGGEAPPPSAEPGLHEKIDSATGDAADGVTAGGGETTVSTGGGETAVPTVGDKTEKKEGVLTRCVQPSICIALF